MSTLETLLIIFIIVTAVAVVIQMGVMVALYVSVKKSMTHMEGLANQVQTRALPALETAQTMLQEYRPKLDTIVSNLEATSTAVRQQVDNVNSNVSEVVDRTRMQVARVDELVSRTLDRVEDATAIVHESIISPIRQASGVLQGVTAGLATLFGRGPYARARRGVGTPSHADMFI